MVGCARRCCGSHGVLGRVIPLMRATGNLQWDERYPNAAVFAQDVERTQLWVAEIDGAIAGVAAVTKDQHVNGYITIGGAARCEKAGRSSLWN